MDISYMAINRMAEEKASADAAYRKAMEKNRRPLLSHGRGMSDDALLAKLHALGLDAERQRLLDIFPRFISAQAMAKQMIDRAPSSIPSFEMDWVWIAITCLWERWQPQLPNTEMVDDKMQAGYTALATGDTAQACRFWLETWRAILDIMQRDSIDSLDAFDARFGGTQCVFNWVQDLETELHNAGLQEPQFFHERIAVCETVLDRFSHDSLPLDGFKRALAESYFELGERETGDRLFRRWLNERSQSGWTWIGWSDCYWLFAEPNGVKDAARAEQILKEGLASPGVEDQADILERLAQLYEETGRGAEAETIREEIKRLQSPKMTTTGRHGHTSVQVKQTLDFGDEGLPLEQLPGLVQSLKSARLAPGDSVDKPARVGRNEPCPCGSGKKYKKCCGKRGVSESDP